MQMCMHVHTHVCMHVYEYECMYVFVYVCVYENGLMDVYTFVTDHNNFPLDIKTFIYCVHLCVVSLVTIVEHLIAQNDTIRIIRFAPVQLNRCFVLNISSEISWTAWSCRWKNVHGMKPSESKLTFVM